MHIGVLDLVLGEINAFMEKYVKSKGIFNFDKYTMIR